MSRNIEDLDVSIKEKAIDAWERMNHNPELKDLGVDTVIINETRRSMVTQMAYYSKGRMAVCDTRAMYKAAGLYEPSESECRQIITWTLNSKHIIGKAIDFVPCRNRTPWWTAPDAVWEKMGEIGESCGLKWGGRWKNKDCPHFEVD